MLEEVTHNSPEIARDGWMHSTPWLLEVMGFPKCNKGDIDWYMRIPTDTPQADPKARKLPRQCEEADGTLRLASSMIERWLPH